MKRSGRMLPQPANGHANGNGTNGNGTALAAVRAQVLADLRDEREAVLSRIPQSAIPNPQSENPFRPARVRFTERRPILGSARLLASGWVEVYDDETRERPVRPVHPEKDGPLSEREARERTGADFTFEAGIEAFERWAETMYLSFPAASIREIAWLRDEEHVTDGETYPSVFDEPLRYEDPFAGDDEWIDARNAGAGPGGDL
jgi:hypothetical protein